MPCPRFIGRHREIDLIKGSWERACAGRPQVVNLIADTGVGKTRLVESFYKWLSDNQGQCGVGGNQNYWPGSLADVYQREVNPLLKYFPEFDFKNSRIPWLWWGMKWPEAECAVVQYHKILDTHLEMLDLERRCRLNNLEALSDVAKDEILDFFSDFIPGGGQVKSVINLVQSLHNNYHERRRRKKGVVDYYRDCQDAIAEDIISRLQVVFNPRKKEVPRIPMVVFLDDVHFAADANEDEFSLHFLERLLRRAARDKWPVLVVATHWKEPWKAHLLLEGSKKGKSWRRLMLELMEEEDGNSLDIHDIELINVPYEDLRSIALDHLPGLSISDQRCLLSRVDNVRWLVEALHALNDNIDNFEDNDRSKPLSCYGRRRLDELLKTRGYLEVIRQRFEGDAMQEVRNVLGAAAWHAHGLELLSPLARAFGEELLNTGALVASNSEPGQRVVDVMLRAINPAALLEASGLNDQALPSLVRFPERGYLEIARELFDSERLPNLRLALGREVVSWMQDHGSGPPRWKQLKDINEQKLFLEIAVAVLEQLRPKLSEEQKGRLSAIEMSLKRQVEKGRITEEELQKELDETRSEMRGEVEEKGLPRASKYQAFAMAQLSCLLQSEMIFGGFVNRRALEMACEFAENPSFTILLDELEASIKYDLYKILINAKFFPQAHALVDSYVKDLSIACEGNAGHQQLRHFFSVVYEMGSWERVLGLSEKSYQSHLLCMKIMARMFDEFGTSHDDLKLVTPVLYGLNDSSEALELVGKVRAHYRRFIARLVSSSGRSSASHEERQFLAGVMRKYAYFELEAGDKEFAEAGYKYALRLGVSLVSELVNIDHPWDLIGEPVTRLKIIYGESGGSGEGREDVLNCMIILEAISECLHDSEELKKKLDWVLMRLRNNALP